MRKENRIVSKQPRKCTVTEIYQKKGGCINPALVTFQNGELRNRHLDLSSVLTHTTNGMSIQVDICGHVFKESCLRKKPCRSQIVAIRNKISNKIRLVEVDAPLLINSALVKTPTLDTGAADSSKGMKNLYKTFGGKKAVNHVVRAEKLNFSSMLIADELKQAIAEMEVDTTVSLDQIKDESLTHLLPPCHRESKIVSDVYQIREILSERELESLIKNVKDMEENKFNPTEYSQFFVNCYSEAKKIEENIMVRLAGVLFAEALIKFLKIPPRGLTLKKTVVCPFSDVIGEKLMNEFCIKKGSSVTRPEAMKDKCLCYLMAVTLICCNYKINLQLLQNAVTSFKMSRLLRLARVVGAVPTSKTGYLCTLKMPLPAFPKSQKERLRKN